MQTQYVLVLLTFATFAGIARAKPREEVKLRFARLQYHIDKVSGETYPQFTKIENDLETREAPIRQDVLNKFSGAVKEFNSKQNQELVKARKEGTDPKATEICVRLEQANYLVKLHNKKIETLERIKGITQTARTEVRNAKSIFDRESFAGKARSDLYEKDWIQCMVKKNEECEDRVAAQYMDRIAKTEAVAKTTRELATVAYRTQEKDLNECKLGVKGQIEELQKEHNANVAKCMANPIV